MKKILFTVVIFMTWFSELDAQTGFSGETGIITMDTKNPIINLQAPNGGGSYIYTLPLNITWSATDDSFGAAPISAGLSTEAGGAVNWLGTNLANSGTTNITPPQVATTEAKAHIKAVDAFGNEAVDMSDGYFELFEPCQNATASAGQDANITNGESYTLNGAAENHTSILWETNGDGTFDNAASLGATYYPGSNDIAGQQVELCLTAFAEAPCEDATDCMTLSILPAPPEVSNVTAAQRTDGSGLLDITYDLTGNEISYAVLLEISTDNGHNYQPTGQATGAIGEVTPGSGLEITLDLNSEYPDGIFNDNMKVKVTAEIPFECGTILTDARDGQEYNTILINEQCWMAENLSYLPEVSPSSQGSDTDLYYYVYGYQGSEVSVAKATANYQTFGALYNWPASLVACPVGWHLPTIEEWISLTEYIKTQPEYICNYNSNYIAKALAANSFWFSSAITCAVGNDQASNNSTGFSGLPGGARWSGGAFSFYSMYGIWWSSTVSSYTPSLSLGFNNSQFLINNSSNEYGFNVRCLKN